MGMKQTTTQTEKNMTYKVTETRVSANEPSMTSGFASCVQLENGCKAWGFGNSAEEAEGNAFTSACEI